MHEVTSLETRFDEGEARIIGLPVLYTLGGATVSRGTLIPWSRGVYIVQCWEDEKACTFFCFANGLFTISRWVRSEAHKQRWWFPDT